MISFVLFLIGIAVGAVACSPLVVYLFLKFKQRRLEIEAEGKTLKEDLARAKTRLETDMERLSQQEAALKKQKAALDQSVKALELQQSAFASRTIAYEEYIKENEILKRDLQNLDVTLNKLELDGELRERRQRELDTRSQELGRRFLRDTVKATISALGPNNFAASKQRLLNAIHWCRDIGFPVAPAEEANLLADLKAEFERAVKAEFEREEQARIKTQIREEQRLQREVQAELQRLERERTAIKAALDQALAEANNQHTAEVQRLQARLAEADEKSRRAISLAQQTKAGHVYVISNVGSFGKGVFKIGMTRRLDPHERIGELGSASVPFPFDVHMMISCDNAPALENALHRQLHKARVNKVRPRKEFFRSEIEAIAKIVRENHGDVEYIADPEALEYAQSNSMSEDDELYIEKVYNEHDDEETVTDEL